MPRVNIDVLIELLERHGAQLYQLYTISTNNTISDELLRMTQHIDTLVERLEETVDKKFILQDPPPVNNLQ
jgi:hypothetical protein